MREVAFIRQNKEKWLDFERALKLNSKKNPDDLASGYIGIMNDLSYAQTYYPKSKTVVYLNHLAVQIYQKIYKTKRSDGNKVRYFFLTEVPLLLYQYRTIVAYSFVLFFATVAIGAVSARFDTNFVRFILGDEYVNKTLENISQGNPVAVYKSGSNWGSFIGITMNNIYVGARCFLYGIFAGIGTFWIALQNGIMLGAFQYFFYDRGVFWVSVRGIWIHGAMEIFAIVIETACGFILAASLLFPKSFSRLESLKRGFKDSFKIFLSTLPFTISAGFLEGFVTRYSPDMPIWASVGIILITLFLIAGYYLVYPYRVISKMRKDVA